MFNEKVRSVLGARALLDDNDLGLNSHIQIAESYMN